MVTLDSCCTPVKGQEPEQILKSELRLFVGEFDQMYLTGCSLVSIHFKDNIQTREYLNCKLQKDLMRKPAEMIRKILGKCCKKESPLVWS